MYFNPSIQCKPITKSLFHKHTIPGYLIMPSTSKRFLRPVKLISCLLCVGFTLYRVQVSIHEYSADNSVTSIGYQDFLSEPGYTYPAITLCVEKQRDEQSVPEIGKMHQEFNRSAQSSSSNNSINHSSIILVLLR